MRTGFCICEGMMVGMKVISAGCGHCRKLVVRKRASEVSACCPACIIEDIVRIIHLIHPEHSLQAAFIERAVVGHQRKSPDQRLDLLPDIREDRGIVSIGMGKPVDPLAEPLEIVRLRVDEAIECIGYLSCPYHCNTYRAYAALLLIGGLEIYCCKIIHLLLVFLKKGIEF